VLRLIAFTTCNGPDVRVILVAHTVTISCERLDVNSS
jgi:hypothetical protein